MTVKATLFQPISFVLTVAGAAGLLPPLDATVTSFVDNKFPMLRFQERLLREFSFLFQNRHKLKENIARITTIDNHGKEWTSMNNNGQKLITIDNG